MSISRKASLQNLSITSAFQRDSFHGHLYVEARSEAHVRDAVHGLVGIYITNSPALVPIEEMPDLLKSKRKETPLAVGGWVRIKRGTYKGDLAQVDDVPEGGEMISLKVVPRIDLNPREDKENGVRVHYRLNRFKWLTISSFSTRKRNDAGQPSRLSSVLRPSSSMWRKSVQRTQAGRQK